MIHRPTRRDLFRYGGATLAALARMRGQSAGVVGAGVSTTGAPPPVIPPSGATIYVNTNSTPGGDGTTNATVGAHRAYASLWECLQVINNTTLTIQTTILHTGNDTTAVTSIDVITPTADKYLMITPAPGQRHSGVWDANKSTLSATDIYVLRNNTTSYLRVDGMQIHFTQNSGSHYGTKLLGANNTGPFDIRYSNLIVWGTIAAGSATGITCDDPASGSGICRAWNCIVYGFPSGFGGFATPAAANFTVYNGTAYGNSFSYVVDGNWCAINCISASPSGGDFVGPFTAASDYNSASGTCPGAHSRNNQTFLFANPAGFDFHLQAGDGGAKGFGLADPASGLFSDDISGVTRTVPWSIGAFQ